MSYQAVEARELQHQQDINSLRDTLERDKQDSLDQMKTSMTGEKQVLFNEALNKVVCHGFFSFIRACFLLTDV